MAVPKVNLRKIIRKKSITYMLDYTVDGSRKRISAGSNRRDAELIKTKIQHDLATGKFQISPPEIKNISLSSLVDEFVIHKTNTIRSSSLKRYKNYFDSFQTYFNENFPTAVINIKLIRDVYVKSFINDMLSKKEKGEGTVWSKKTVNGMIVAVKSLFSYAISKGYIEKSPLNDLPKYKIPTIGKVEYFTDEELKLLWANLDPFWVDPLRFMLHTGLRKGEMINLKWKNVLLDIKEPCIVVTSDEEWQTKNGASRSIPLNKDALEIIKRAKGKHPEYVFISKTGLVIHPDKPLRAMKKALEECNLNGDIHKLRHTFASKLVMAGVDLYTVGKLLGHSDLKSTQIYTHLSTGHLKDSVDKIKN